MGATKVKFSAISRVRTRGLVKRLSLSTNYRVGEETSADRQVVMAPIKTDNKSRQRNKRTADTGLTRM